jgi:hypothetical protein
MAALPSPLTALLPATPPTAPAALQGKVKQIVGSTLSDLGQ